MLAVLLKPYDSTAFRPPASSSFTPAEICTLIRIRVRWPYAEVCPLYTCYLWHMKEFSHMAQGPSILFPPVKVVMCIELIGHQSTALRGARAPLAPAAAPYIRPAREASTVQSGRAPEWETYFLTLGSQFRVDGALKYSQRLSQ